MRSAPLIVHVGIAGDRPGGIAQVVNQYVRWAPDGWVSFAISSTRGKRDPLAVILWLAAVARLVGLRLVRGRVTVLVHLSAKGSFLREGSIVLLSSAIGHRVGIHLHGSQFPEFSSKSPRLVRTICGAARVVFSLTDETTDILTKLHLPPRTSVVTVVNAVDVPDEETLKRKWVLFGGEVGLRKGVDTLLASWAEVSVAFPDWELHIIGPISSSFTVSYPGTKTLIFHGALPHEEMLRFQASAAIAVLPSRQEAMPMFLLESMARGCAVVSTPVGQISTLLDGVGDVVPVGNTASLSASLVDLMGSSAKCEEHGRLARARVLERYSAAAARDGLSRAWVQLGQGSHVHV